MITTDACVLRRCTRRARVSFAPSPKEQQLKLFPKQSDFRKMQGLAGHGRRTSSTFARLDTRPSGRTRISASHLNRKGFSGRSIVLWAQAETRTQGGEALREATEGISSLVTQA